jgi:hypothetical protein
LSREKKFLGATFRELALAASAQLGAIQPESNAQCLSSMTPNRDMRFYPSASILDVTGTTLDAATLD